MSTSGTIKRRTALTGTNNPAYQVSKDVYNDSLVVASAAADGLVAVRDSAQSDGWGFVPPGDLSFLQAGTGGVARTLTSRLQDTVHVKDFGAVANGATNPLSTRFGTLGAAQAVYPHAVALTDELDWAAAQAAVAYLGTRSGGMAVFDGSFYVFNRPLLVSGLTRISLVGTGQHTSISTSTAGLEALIIFRNASLGLVRDFELVVNNGGTATYGLLVTATSSTQHVLIENVLAGGNAGTGVCTNGFGVGCDTVNDVSEITFVHCRAEHCVESGFLFGNGSSGNVLDIRGYGCVAAHNKYGVNFDGSAAQWYGFASIDNSIVDFRRGSPCATPIVIDGGRSEGSKRFWQTSGGTYAQSVSIRSVFVASFTDVGGVALYHDSQSPLTILDSTFIGGAANATGTFFVSSANPTPVTAINVYTTGTPFTNYNDYNVIRAFNCWQVDGDGVPILGTNIDRTGLKHQRVTTGSIGAGASAVVTVTWTVAFADANYTPMVSVLDTTAAVASLRIVKIESKTASVITVRVENTSAGSLTGTLHAMAMHD